MSRHSFVTAFLTASLVLMPVVAQAQLTPENTGLAGAAAGTGLNTSCSGSECLLSIIGNVINLILGFLGVVLLVMLLYAGFLWMTAGGEGKQVQTAKDMIGNAVAGVIIVAVSYAITAFVLSQLATIAGDGAGGGAESGGRPEACASYSCDTARSIGCTSGSTVEGCGLYSACCE